MKISLGDLRRIIQESVQPELVETFDDCDYEVNVEHDKTFDLPNGEKYLAKGYESSQLRAKIDVARGVLIVVYIRVANSQQGGSLALRMLQRAGAFARSRNLRMVSSGVYTQISQKLLDIFERRGLVKSVNGVHEFDLTRL